MGGQEMKVKFYRTVRKTRATTVKRKWSKAAIQRSQKLSKFGDCQGKPKGTEKGITSQTPDELEFEFVHERARKLEEKRQQLENQPKRNLVNCKYCGGNHFAVRCPKKSIYEDQ